MNSSKTIFNNKLSELLKGNTNRSGFMTDKRYETVIREIEEARRIQKIRRNPLSSKQYRQLKRYDICEVNGTKKLIEKRAKGEQGTNKTRFYCKESEVFDVLESVHCSLDHKRTIAMDTKLKENYCNIAHKVIHLYLSLCEQCKLKKKMCLKIPSIVSNCMKSRCQVNLINMRAKPDNDNQFIMNYQDLLTMFTILRPLKSNSAKEFAYQLVDIFSIFGTPCILQCNYGREFAKTVIDHLAKIWPGVKIVHGKSKGSRRDQQIREKLFEWMAKNNSEKWSEGLNFIQNNRNRSYNHGSKISPYQAMFGVPPKIGLTKSKISSGMYSSLNTEEELDLFLKSERQSEEKGEVNDTKSIEHEELPEAKYIKTETNSEEFDTYYVEDISEIEHIKIVKFLEELKKEELSPVETKFYNDTPKS